MSSQSPLLVDISQGICIVTLNRPAQYNALAHELLDALSSTLTEIAGNESVRAVIIAGNGKAFCAGHDLKQMRQSAEKAEHTALFEKCSAVMLQISTLPQPVIARVQGMATAAGCQLVATCDLAVASTAATFAVSGIRVGLFCSTPAVALSRNIARKKAMEMLMTGEFIDAETAREYGLVNQVVEPGQLEDATLELTARIIRHPRRVVALGKALFYQQLNQDIAGAYATATDTIADNMMLDETLEGIDAFIEKREPDWK